MLCPACRAANTDDAEACHACGRSLFALTTGSLLAGRYEVRSLLGQGGMGLVYRAHDRELGVEVAVKVLRPDRAGSAAAASRLRTEIRLARRVRHPNVCAMHEYGAEGSARFLVMEFVPGLDLRSVLRKRGRLPRREAWSIAIQLADGLAAIHAAGVVHRDLKASNVLVGDDGTARLLDFGIARDLENLAGVTATGQVFGTPEYMSPEQARGEHVDARSDLYSLGVLLFELFSGALPFRGQSPVATILQHLQQPPPLNDERARRLPASLRPVLERLLAKEREQRDLSAADVAAALRAGRAAEAAHPDDASLVAADGDDPTGPLPAISLESRSTPAEPAAGGLPWRRLGLAAALAVVGLALWLGRRPAGSSEPVVSEADRARAEAEFAEASRLLDAGDAPRALPRLARALRLDPASVTTRAVAAEMLLRRDWPVPGREFVHPLPVTAARFAAAGDDVAVADAEGLTLYTADGTRRARLGPADSFDFSLDGRRLVTRDGGTAVVWRTQDGMKIGPGATDAAMAAISPDGRRLAVGSPGGTRLLDVESGTVLASLPGTSPTAITFSPDNALLATGDQRSARVLDLATLRERSRLAANVLSFEFDAGHRLLVVSRDGAVTLVDLGSGKPLRLPVDSGAASREARFVGSTQRQVLTFSVRGPARLWNLETGEARTFSGPGITSAAGLRGERLALADDQGQVHVWNWRDMRRAAETVGSDAAIVAAWLSTDGTRLRTVAVPGTVRTWHVAAAPLPASLAHPGGLDAAGFAAGGDRVTTSGDDDQVRVWDVSRARELATLRTEGELRAIDVAGSCVATASTRGVARLWNLDGRPHGPELRHSAAVLEARFSIGGRRLATGSADGQAQVWDVRRGAPQGRPLEHPDPVEQLRFGPDEEALVTVAGGLARVWDLATGRLRLGPLPHVAAVPPAFGADGRSVLVFGLDRVLRRIDLVSGQVQAESGTQGRLLSFRPDGRRAVSTSGGVVTIWDTESGQVATRTAQHPREILAASLDPEGARLVTASADGQARLWNATTGALLGVPVVDSAPLTIAAFDASGGRLLTTTAAERALARVAAVPLPPVSAALPMADMLEVLAGRGEVDAAPGARWSRLGARSGEGAASLLVRLFAEPGPARAAGCGLGPGPDRAPALPPVDRALAVALPSPPLLSASERVDRGDFAGLRAQLAAGLDPRAVLETHGGTLLHVAAERCQVAIVRLLLAHGARQPQNAWGDTPLEIAANRCGPGSATARVLRRAP
ncbi:MAG: protein kinase [Vicinamibacteria bacterium]|nr:protein kinase [Vicinamibacteria bacterium]